MSKPREFWLTRGNDSGPNELTHICLFEYHADKNPLRLIEYSVYIQVNKNFEAWGWKQMNYIGLTERIVNPVVLVATPIIQQKVSTKAIHFHWEPAKDLTLRPDVEYNFVDKTTNSTFTLNWRF
jgi:hypothetical protein